MKKNFEFIDKAVNGYEEEICRVSDSIWDMAEVSFREVESVKLLMNELENKGFTIKSNIGGMPTAFSASFGSGHPVIGFLAEYDALVGLSQVADSTEKESVTEGGDGHGCGHHLLGAGCYGAAIAVRDYIEQNNLPGTVVFFGCPAEEGGGGKIFMARSGVFDDVDIAMSWHPDCINAVHSGSSLANTSMRYIFKGKAAHAAGCPHLGRSALDAVELMNVGCNFLREHIIPEARLHYAITDAGGKVTNIVQARAESLYLIRAPKNDQVAEIVERVNKVALGAAMMTETEVDIIFNKACSYFIPNDVVSRGLYEAMETVPIPDYTDEDMAYARKFIETYKTGDDDPRLEECIRKRVKKYEPSGNIMTGSTDVSDVSMNCPTAWFFGAAYALGTPFHSWQMVAQGKSGIAHKGLIYASKVMALAAAKFLTDPEGVRLAKEELIEKRGPKGYVCPIPMEVAPGVPEDVKLDR